MPDPDDGAAFELRDDSVPAAADRDVPNGSPEVRELTASFEKDTCTGRVRRGKLSEPE